MVPFGQVSAQNAIIKHRIRSGFFRAHSNVKLWTKRSNFPPIVCKADLSVGAFDCKQLQNTSLISITMPISCLRKLNFIERIIRTGMNKIACERAENAIRIIVYDSILFILFVDYVRRKLIKISYDLFVSALLFPSVLVILLHSQLSHILRSVLALHLTHKMQGMQYSLWIV